MSKLHKKTLKTGVGKNVEHDSAAKQVTGEATYVDDRLEYPNQLHVYIGTSTQAHAKITKLDTSPCYDFSGVACVITQQNIPGDIDIGAILPETLYLQTVKSNIMDNPFLQSPQIQSIRREKQHKLLLLSINLFTSAGR